MKEPRTDRQNVRILRLASRVLSLPFVFARAVVGRVAALLQLRKSDKRVRAEDQLRQSRARRELRGLPPDHVPGPPKPS